MWSRNIDGLGTRSATRVLRTRISPPQNDTWGDTSRLDFDEHCPR